MRVSGGVEVDDDVSFDLGSQIHYSHINSGHVIHQILPAQEIDQVNLIRVNLLMNNV